VRFLATDIPGCWILEPERLADERGYFARTWCARELGERGLEARLVQCSVSWNRRRGTLRGMHYQAPPCAEAKVVRCTHGAIYDVAVDLRPDSPTFRRWVGAQLTRENGRALYIPRGFGHGFLTLQDDTELSYQMSEFYVPEQARGVRWDDPLFGIEWPGAVQVIAPRDRDYPDADPARLRELCGL
jgi:dTDP-4-dehydrorhamnose 3,5-epimerase